MSGAADKRAFQAMLDEVGNLDSDSDSDGGKEVYIKPSKKKEYIQETAAPPKNSSRGYIATEVAPNKIDDEIKKFGSDGNNNRLSNNSRNSNAGSQSSNFNRRWVTRPCSIEDPTIQCFVEREKTGFGIFPTFRLFLEGTESTQDAVKARFIMAAKRLTKSNTPYYLVSLDHNPSNDRGSESVVGKIRGNSIGTDYSIFDHGMSPQKAGTPSMLRKEYGQVSLTIEPNTPSVVNAWIPAVNATGTPTVWQPSANQPTMAESVNNNSFDRLIALRNKTARWDPAYNGHVLDFQGRVKISSVKNFQLISSDTAEEVVLQFGKVSENKYIMDVKYPLSLYQAFGICLACLDVKIADQPGYQLFNSLSGGQGQGYNHDDAKGGAEYKNMSGGGGGSRGGGVGYSGSSSSSRNADEGLPSFEYLKNSISRRLK